MKYDLTIYNTKRISRDYETLSLAIVRRADIFHNYFYLVLSYNKDNLQTSNFKKVQRNFKTRLNSQRFPKPCIPRRQEKWICKRNRCTVCSVACYQNKRNRQRAKESDSSLYWKRERKLDRLAETQPARRHLSRRQTLGLCSARRDVNYYSSSCLFLL